MILLGPIKKQNQYVIIKHKKTEVRNKNKNMRIIKERTTKKYWTRGRGKSSTITKSREPHKKTPTKHDNNIIKEINKIMRESNQPIVEPSIISFNFDELTK